MQNVTFSLRPLHWYAWQMLPGYGNKPYFSPIYVRRISPLKTGKCLLSVQFFNAFYASGVQEFEVNLRVLKRAEEYLIAEIIQGHEKADRVAIVSEITFPWIELLCPTLLSRFPLDKRANVGLDVQEYLNRIFSVECK